MGDATFAQPVEVGAYPGGRVFVAERGGQVWLVTDSGARSPLGDFGPIVEAERGEGLLSLALDPRFAETGWVWAYYFAAEEPWRSVLSRFEVLDGRIALESELAVLEIEQPGFNQNGGAVRFDREGYLYLSVGDGSASMDPFDQGQDTSTLLATVLRLDVSAASEVERYRVPRSNPFVDDVTVRPEIFAYGFRNPWRMTIDLESGDIWLGDVGVSNAEEIDRVEAGGNYGWSVFEGTRCLGRECDDEGLTAPIYEYPHDESRCAAVGGVVYRGDALDHLDGVYLFGDLCSGEI
jgi:glucose/arabinose dehydrogenase